MAVLLKQLVFGATVVLHLAQLGCLHKALSDEGLLALTIEIAVVDCQLRIDTRDRGLHGASETPGSHQRQQAAGDG